jgi:putative spermidine/putrescine transport system permease protein
MHAPSAGPPQAGPDPVGDRLRHAAAEAVRSGPPAWLQALPFGAVFLFFFIAPLLLIGAVSFWPTSDYELIPGFTGQNYVSIFEGCANLAEPCDA